MKRIFTASVLAVLAMTLSPAAANDASGTVLLPTAGNVRGQRCPGVPNGIFAYIVDARPNRPFTLKAADPGPMGVNDFDIDFFKSIPSCEAASDPVATEHTNVEGDEAGTVPSDAAKAVIYLFAGVPNSGFTYDET